MFNEPVFRIALVISVAAHVIGFAAGGLFSGNPFPEKPPEVEIAYLAPEPPLQQKIIEDLPRDYELEKKELQKRSEEKKENEDLVTENNDSALPEERYLEEEELAKLEDYIQYYELIREKIRKKVADTYSRSAGEGSVNVAFTLNRGGSLKSLHADKTDAGQAPSLKDTAMRSVKSAAPFPPFPPSLERGELTFQIRIVFSAARRPSATR